mmetsp:Transcript_37648/g.67158  ORF Transcript_37648/g.67158 Transcript_37648/m.67158 type:complete len:248 (-) Transcript_37648:1077-1820(-)
MTLRNRCSATAYLPRNSPPVTLTAASLVIAQPLLSETNSLLSKTRLWMSFMGTMRFIPWLSSRTNWSFSMRRITPAFCASMRTRSFRWYWPARDSPATPMSVQGSTSFMNTVTCSLVMSEKRVQQCPSMETIIPDSPASTPETHLTCSPSRNNFDKPSPEPMIFVLRPYSLCGSTTYLSPLISTTFPFRPFSVPVVTMTVSLTLNLAVLLGKSLVVMVSPMVNAWISAMLGVTSFHCTCCSLHSRMW